MIYGHGNNLSLYEKEIIADFSSNIISRKVSEELLVHLCNSLKKIANYPEPIAKKLQYELASFHHLDNENILVTNGATEAFYLIAHYYKNKSSLVFTPSFAEYEDACRLHNHNLNYVPIQTKLNDLETMADTVWLGNPNNPEGTLTRLNDIRRFCENHPKTCLIIDEAYAELGFDFETASMLVKDFENLIITRSLTKTFTIPGLRLGYIIAHKKIQKQLLQHKMPWSVNTLAIEAGLFIIKNYDKILPDIKEILTASQNLQLQLDEIEGINIIPSPCNFFLCSLSKGNATELQAYLIEKKGILIRDASNFRGLDASYFRIAVQKTAKNNLLLEGIKEWMKQ